MASADREQAAAGRPSKLPAAPPGPVAAAARPAFIDALPEEICQRLFGFLPRWDVGSLMEVDRVTRRAAAQALHVWAVKGSSRAGALFLEHARELRCFRFELAHSSDGGDDGGGEDQEGVGVDVYRSLGVSTVGAQLRSLCLPGLPSEGSAALLAHLEAGRMPFLTEVGVVPERGWEERGRYPVLTTDGDALATALEARGRLGLPPLTRITGIAGLDPTVLRRVWACCPANTTAHLEAQGVGQVWALGQHLLEHADFGALRTLRVMGRQSGSPKDALPGGWCFVCDALAQGHLPGLEEVTLDEWENKVGPISEVGRLIGDGALPKLASLSVLRYRGYDFRGMVDGLCRATQPALRRLILHEIPLTEGEASHVARAIEEGKGLACLDVLEWPYDADRGCWVLEALGGKAPCARTLTALSLAGDHLTAEQVRAFLWAFDQNMVGENAFPCLQKLRLEGEWMNEGMLREFSDALVRLVENGNPAGLKMLDLGSQFEGEFMLLEALTPAFAADGLPSLTHMSAPLNWTGNYYNERGGEKEANSLFGQWAALGPRIRLEVVTFTMYDKSPRRQLLEALANPAFLPFLLRLDGCCDTFDIHVKAALDRRGLARLGIQAIEKVQENMEDGSIEGEDRRRVCPCDVWGI